MNAENTALEVFGTKEVSVKEFMGSTDKSLVLLSDYEKAKANLEELKTKYEARVEELVSVEKLSSEENKELNSIRAELREPRYLIQNIEKNNISVFEAYKKTDKANLKSLIEINVSLEDKATAKLQAEEQRKKDEKEQERQAEEKRIEKIKSDIDNIETYCYQVIQKMTFETLKSSTEAVDQSLNADYDFEEFDLLLDQVKDRVAKQLLDKTNDITAREQQRQDNERMKQEIFDVRVNRLKEVGFTLSETAEEGEEVVFFCDNTDIPSSSVYNQTADQFEQMLSDIKINKEKAEQAKRDAELKKEKDEQFEVRKNRLAEIGVFEVNNENQLSTLDFIFRDNDKGFSKSAEIIYNASVTEFEQILVEAKQAIANAKEQKEKKDKEERFSTRKEKLVELGFECSRLGFTLNNSDFKLELEDIYILDEKGFDLVLKSASDVVSELKKAEQKKADAENKAREKRLAKDKAIYENVLRENLNRFPIVFDSKEKEILDFSAMCSNRIATLLNELLTELKEL
ncbi:MAG: hypothetical protein ACK518_04325 [bacterium]|jgi:hypothetical protein